MTLLADLVRRGLALPPHIAVYKTGKFIARLAAARLKAWCQSYRCSYITPSQAAMIPSIALPFQEMTPYTKALLISAQRITAHRFDLLGSGVCNWSRTGPAPQVNFGNRRMSSELRKMLPVNYRPLDWHRDIMSGHTWRSDKYCTEIRPAFGSGVDIKRPWEISRLQHLPRLALAARLGKPEEADVWNREIRNQLLDFSGHNPPSFGVAWACTMDAAIRAANIWLTAALLDPASTTTPEVTAQACSMLREHGRHISDHLEWAPDIRGNHYICDLAGLIFCALPFDDPEADAWLAFAILEFTSEAREQMLPDGANFEASTSYHRLVSETIAWTFAVLATITHRRMKRMDDIAVSAMPRPPQNRIPAIRCRSILGDIVLAAARFTAAVLPEGNLAPQIGDNDDGRFITLNPEGALRDHRDFLALAGALTGWREAFDAGQDCRLDAVVAAALSPTPSFWSRPLINTFSVFPDFGLFVWRNGRSHLTFRCGSVGQHGNGGHAHNDQLSFTLIVNGIELLIDTGTGHYTAWPHWRNYFRSTAAHNTLVVDGCEQNRWEEGSLGLFRLRDEARGEVLSASPEGIEAMHHGYGRPHRRRLKVLPMALEGSDICTAAGAKALHFHLGPAVDCHLSQDHVVLSAPGVTARLWAQYGKWGIRDSYRSDGYGRISPNRCLVFEMDGDEALWRISWQ